MKIGKKYALASASVTFELLLLLVEALQVSEICNNWRR